MVKNQTILEVDSYRYLFETDVLSTTEEERSIFWSNQKWVRHKHVAIVLSHRKRGNTLIRSQRQCCG